MSSWTILATPYFHFWIGAVALIVLVSLYLMWHELKRYATRGEKLMYNIMLHILAAEKLIEKEKELGKLQQQIIDDFRSGQCHDDSIRSSFGT